MKQQQLLDNLHDIDATQMLREASKQIRENQSFCNAHNFANAANEIIAMAITSQRYGKPDDLRMTMLDERAQYEMAQVKTAYYEFCKSEELNYEELTGHQYAHDINRHWKES